MTIGEITHEIVLRFGTVYRFCRVSGLNKSTVYGVLSGRYPADNSKMLARIRLALDGLDGEITEDAVYAVLETIGCERCRLTDRRRCRGCRNTRRAQARAVMEIIDV